MEFRFLVLCDENGCKSEPILQFRENENEGWNDVPWKELKTYEYDEEAGLP